MSFYQSGLIWLSFQSYFIFSGPLLVHMVSLDKLEKSNPSSRLLILSENHLNLSIYLKKTLYCHLPEKFCNNYTNLQCPWHKWCLLGLCCVKPTWLYTTFLQPFILYNNNQFAVFRTCWNCYLCLIPPPFRSTKKVGTMSILFTVISSVDKTVSISLKVLKIHLINEWVIK